MPENPSSSQSQKLSANERIAVVLETMATKSKLTTNDKRWISKKLKEMEPTFWDRFWHWWETDDTAPYVLMVAIGIAGVIGTKIIKDLLEEEEASGDIASQPKLPFFIKLLLKMNLAAQATGTADIPGYQENRSYIDNILCGTFGAMAAIGLYILIVKAMWKNGAPQGTGSVLGTWAGAGLMGFSGFVAGSVISDLP